MEQKDWIKVLDHYLRTGKMLSEHYEMMDDFQRAIIQELKKAFKRLTYNNDKN